MQTISWETGEKAIVRNSQRVTATIELQPVRKTWHVKRVDKFGDVTSWTVCETVRQAEFYAVTGNFQ